MERQIATLQGQVTGLDQWVASLDQGWDALKGQVTNLQQLTTTLEGRRGDLRADVAMMQAECATFRADVATLRVDVATLQGREGDLDVEVATLRGQVAILADRAITAFGNEIAIRLYHDQPGYVRRARLSSIGQALGGQFVNLVYLQIQRLGRLKIQRNQEQHFRTGRIAQWVVATLPLLINSNASALARELIYKYDEVLAAPAATGWQGKEGEGEEGDEMEDGWGEGEEDWGTGVEGWGKGTENWGQGEEGMQKDGMKEGLGEEGGQGEVEGAGGELEEGKLGP